MRTFKAASMREALGQVKRELGTGAVILGTRSYRTGGFLGLRRRDVVEITASADGAALERTPKLGASAGRRHGSGANPSPGPKGPSSPKGEGLATAAKAVDHRVRQTYGQLVAEAKDKAVHVSAGELRGEMSGLKEMVSTLIRETRAQRLPDVPAELFDTYVRLLGNEVADELAKDLVKRIREQLPESEWGQEHRVRETLVRYVASRIEVAGPIELEGKTPRIIALIGPTGVGKTTTVAKLAAQFKLRQGKSVGLITIDTYRIGAVDQLRTYAEIISVPLKVVLTPKELRRAVDEFADKDVVLIDTAGRNQGDTLRMNELRQFLEAVRPDETHLVISTTAGQRNATAVIEKFSEFQVDRVILTKLDEAVSFGMVLGVLERTRQKLSYVTAGQDVPDDIEPGQSRKLAELIVPAVAATARVAEGRPA
jgi:flagellar biosynthesis protein FlhF